MIENGVRGPQLIDLTRVLTNCKTACIASYTRNPQGPATSFHISKLLKRQLRLEIYPDLLIWADFVSETTRKPGFRRPSPNNETSETTEVKSDARITVEGTGQDDRRQTRREDIHIHQEERRRPVRVTREEEVRFRDDDRRDTRIEVEREHYSQPFRRYASAQIDVEDRVYEKEDRLDITERELRSRFRPSSEPPVWQDKGTYPRQFEEKVKVTEHRTFEEPEHKHKLDMGYHDNEGHYHSFRHGLEKAADRILHPIHGSHHHHHRDSEVVVEDREVFVSAPRRETEHSSRRENKMSSATITIPCHHVRIGDLLILQGRPCQVIRITTSAQTGQHRYLGVDLFTKQLHEESSFVSNPSPSVYVQNMLGPVFKQYRVLDITENGRVVAMTEGGDVKQGLRVLDQSELLQRLTKAYDSGRGSIRTLDVRCINALTFQRA
ncbi:hypothetical protein AMS68_000869 [Peltaster fructicola]|uniref:Translation initiation factor 5A-like N-terminal domain-containing protein n=1 Tax=Peltaster fructicola TaxID=286661 RepID=A0A6H0XKT3_9PEZI|nr:hypothetical protein AMS68_000869 [Peltaster fructicola]